MGSGATKHSSTTKLELSGRTTQSDNVRSSTRTVKSGKEIQHELIVQKLVALLTRNSNEEERYISSCEFLDMLDDIQTPFSCEEGKILLKLIISRMDITSNEKETDYNMIQALNMLHPLLIMTSDLFMDIFHIYTCNMKRARRTKDSWLQYLVYDGLRKLRTSRFLTQTPRDGEQINNDTLSTPPESQFESQFENLYDIDRILQSA